MPISPPIILSQLSDHLPFIVNLGISEKNKKRQKYVQTRAINDAAINIFREELSEINISSLLNANLFTDPNIEHNKFEKILLKVVTSISTEIYKNH